MFFNYFLNILLLIYTFYQFVNSYLLLFMILSISISNSAVGSLFYQ